MASMRCRISASSAWGLVWWAGACGRGRGCGADGDSDVHARQAMVAPAVIGPPGEEDHVVKAVGVLGRLPRLLYVCVCIPRQKMFSCPPETEDG